MELTKIESSNIDAVGFDEGLVVRYKSGSVYKYEGVTEDTYKKLLESESKGRFMNSEIKGKYEYRRLVE